MKSRNLWQRKMYVDDLQTQVRSFYIDHLKYGCKVDNIFCWCPACVKDKLYLECYIRKVKDE